MRPNHQTLTLNKKNRCSFHKASPGQWNQILSGIVCVLGFSLIFTGMLFFTLTEFSENDGNTPGHEDLDKNQRKTTYNTMQCTVQSCTITCNRFDLSNDLSTTLERIYQESMKGNNCKTENIVLNLKDTIFEEKTLYNNWIHNISFYIGELSITGGLEHITPGSFDNGVFSALNKLELADFSLGHLQSGAFDGLSKIQFLIIKDGTISKIDNNVFKPLKLANNVDIQSSAIDLTFFTGNEDLYRVRLVRIIDAKLLEIVTKETFAGLRSVESLYLTNNGIKVIDAHAFAGLTKLKLLHINSNNLKALSLNILSSSLPKPELYVSDNPWNCTCELKWIQEDIRQKIVKDNPVCSYPSEHAYQNISDVEFVCPEEETTVTPITTQTASSTNTGSEITTHPSEPTTSSIPCGEITTNPTTSKPHTTQIESTSTHSSSEITSDTTAVTNNTTSTTIFPSVTTSTTHPTIDEVRINCQAPELNPYTENKYNRKLLSMGTNYIVTKQSLNFSLDDNENGKVTVEILSPLTSADILVWFIGNVNYFGVLESSNAIGCRTIINSKVTVEELVSGETYTFCLMNGGDSKVSPLDCRALAIRMPWNMQMWLANDDKAAIVGIVSVSLILCLLVGAIVIYILIRRNPSLLRGSKRIVMVKHRAAEAIVMPPNFKDVCETKAKEEKRPPKRCVSNKIKQFRRSVSETSIMSTRSAAASYVSAVEPTAVQLLHWRLERLRGSSGGKEPGPGGPLLMPPAISTLPPLPPKRPTTEALILEDESLSGTSEV